MDDLLIALAYPAPRYSIAILAITCAVAAMASSWCCALRQSIVARIGHIFLASGFLLTATRLGLIALANNSISLMGMIGITLIAVGTILAASRLGREQG